MKLTGRQVERIALPRLEVSVLRAGLQLAYQSSLPSPGPAWNPTRDTPAVLLVFGSKLSSQHRFLIEHHEDVKGECERGGVATLVWAKKNPFPRRGRGTIVAAEKNQGEALRFSTLTCLVSASYASSGGKRDPGERRLGYLMFELDQIVAMRGANTRPTRAPPAGAPPARTEARRGRKAVTQGMPWRKEQMSMKTKVLTCTLLAILGTTVSAQAAVLATQPVFVNAGQIFYCKIANVSSKDREVTIETINPSGNVVNTSTTTLSAGASASISEAGAVQNRICRFSTKGGRKSFRAGATVGDNSNDFFAVPAN
jgi:hypothetical protein